MKDLPFALRVMPYHIKYFTCSGDFQESIVLGKDVNDVVTTLLKEVKSIEGIWAIEKIELIRLQESKVLMTKYN
jgi:hypothetical protein